MNSDFTLYDAVRAAGIPVAHACEVGVYLPESSLVLGWINEGVRTTLVECDPVTTAALRQRFGGLSHVTLAEVAVADVPGTLTLYRAGASTFGSNVPKSPALVNDGYRPSSQDAFTAPAVTFDTLDDGMIDVLSIDVEGAEWFVIKHLRSRPRIVSVETHGKRYTNPFVVEITTWMAAHGYGAWYTGASDTVFRHGWAAPVEDRSVPKSLFGRFKQRLRGY